MAALFTSIQAIVTGVSGMCYTWLSVVFSAGCEYIQLCVLLPFVGIGIGLIKRLTRV